MPHIVVSDLLKSRLEKMRDERMLRSLEDVIEKLLSNNKVIDLAVDELYFVDSLLYRVPAIREAVTLDISKIIQKINEMGRKVV